MDSAAIRQAFIDYFKQQGHEEVESSPLVPGNDPTLLFTNAGMVQFKELFLGLESRPYKRAVTAQRCVRAGGKHNDLDNVGYTARHHTYFEMLGNFSFGDYFKREAIQFAWNFLTKVLGLPAEKLWVTVYKDDKEAEAIWLKEIGVSAERFSRCGEKDNFWSMGDTGPCGPCTEIFYDHGPSIPGGPPGSPEEDGDRYVEIWNLVFMQYNRDSSGKLHPLPKPSVDTGMGLERLAAVLQGVHSNYDIDIFVHLIAALAKLKKGLDTKAPSCRVIADHIRSCAFLLMDGVSPSNEGRGYVLRRIIRRAVRHGHSLGLPMPFFHKLVQPLIEVMGEAYPALPANKASIEAQLLKEENQFIHTLDQGMTLLQEVIKDLPAKVIPGETAFKLYDTYGFPLDLTVDIAREQDLVVDGEGFEACMQQQRAQSQAASQFVVDYATSPVAQLQTQFCGYEKNEAQAKVLAILQEGKEVQSAVAGSALAVVLDTTPFYAESGGQVGDQGQLLAKGLVFQVEDVQKVGQAFVHEGRLIQGELSLGQSLNAVIDLPSREATRLNHTATHLLHAALKKVLGAQVQQKGSLVAPEKTRFDFSHSEALTKAEIQAVEKAVNEQIHLNKPVETDIMDLQAAKKSGAVALFGEKYEDAVRVLSIDGFSKELCGGTHARRTGDLGLFKITAEYGIASGVRRIELITGQGTEAWVSQQQALLESLAGLLKTNAASLQEKLAQLLAESKKQEKEIEALRQEKAKAAGANWLAEVKTVAGVPLLVKQLDGADMDGLRKTLDQLKSRLPDGVIVLLTVNGDKMQVVAAVGKTLLGKVPSAADLVRHLCGKGGGREDMAQGGGDVPSDLPEKLAHISSLIEKAG